MQVVVSVEQLRRPVPGGIGVYTRGLLQGLREMGSESPAVSILSTGALPSGMLLRDLPMLRTRLPSRLIRFAWFHGLPGIPGAPRDNSVLHATSFDFPFASKMPVSAVIHDLGWRRFPEAYSKHGISWHESALRRVTGIARLLIVPSRQTESDLRQAIGERQDKVRIEVVEWGVDHMDPPDDAATDELLAQLGVDGKFFVCVGTMEPRKNLTTVVRAFALAKAQLGDSWSLIIVGPKGWGSSTAEDMQEGVKVAGPVTGGVLSCLYSRSAAAVYIPLLEGWGFPAVEAMSMGVPVITSDVPSVAGRGAVVDPLDIRQVADAMVGIATDSKMAMRLADSGRQAVAGMTWLECARRHVRLWEEIT